MEGIENWRQFGDATGRIGALLSVAGGRREETNRPDGHEGEISKPLSVPITYIMLNYGSLVKKGPAGMLPHRATRGKNF